MPLVEPGRAPEHSKSPPVEAAVSAAYWRKTSGLMWTMLVIWLAAGFLIHVFAPALNDIRFLGFPLGFYMAAQGSLIVFVIMLFWFAARQNRIDEEFGVSED